MAYNVLIVGEQTEVRHALREQFEASAGFTVSDAPAIPADIAGDLHLMLVHCTAEGVNSLPAKDDMVLPALFLVEPSLVLALSAHGDTVALPLRMGDLIDTVRQKCALIARLDEKSLTIGPYQFHPSARALTREGHDRIRLTEKESAMLLYLLQANGDPVGREELLKQVWGYQSGVSTHTLETHIYRLRQKIEPENASAPLLITDTAGYRLNS